MSQRYERKAIAITFILGWCACTLPAGCSPDLGESPADRVVPMSPEEIESSPYLVVGEGSEELFQVVTPFLLPDGRLVVPERGGDILIFSTDGVQLETLGGTGGGPGEFQELSAAWPRGDTIEAYDSRLGRITRFPPGEPVDVVMLQQPYPVSPVPGALPDGWLMVAVRGAAPSGRDLTSFIRFAQDGTVLGEIAEVEGMERFRTPMGSGPDPLSPMVRFQVASGKVYLAETFTPAVRVMNSVGDMETELSWDPESTMSARAAFRTVVDSAVARAQPEQAERVRERIESFPVREQMPAFWDFTVDTEGFIWVQPFTPGRHSMALGGDSRRDGGEWWVFSASGERVGEVLVPEGVRLTQVTENHAVGIFRDSLGIESVRAYRLHRN